MAAASLLPGRGHAADANVVVIVDTSISMRERGYDPERASVLVTRLLSDVVPGRLAVVRLLDLNTDRANLPMSTTNITAPCTEDPNQMCTRVEQTEDWGVLARKGLLGLRERPALGDSSFKRDLDDHLAQKSNNSMFYLGFRAGEGFLDQGVSDNRHVIWLSDGRPEEKGELDLAIADLRAKDTTIHGVVFGKGDVDKVRSYGVPAERVHSPGELMAAFSDLFRQIVRAPYEQDGLVASAPTFAIKPAIAEAWVVVYSDDPDLGAATLEAPSGRLVPVDQASDRVPSAGAYRVIRIDRPERGTWTVRLDGAPGHAAYAVVQLADLQLELLGPQTALVGQDVLLTAALRDESGAVTSEPELLAGVRVEVAVAQGPSVTLVDDGTHGDAKAGDGIFSASHRFASQGAIDLLGTARGEVIDLEAKAVVQVSGRFSYQGQPLRVDLGALANDDEACRPIPFDAEHDGNLTFSLDLMRKLPAEHRLEVRGRGAPLVAGGAPGALPPGAPLEICLSTGPTAPSSVADGEQWVTLRWVDGTTTDASVPILLTWSVEGMPWWRRWLWTILGVLGLILLAIVVYGFIYPFRFPAGLSIRFATDRQELDDGGSASPFKTWRRVGSGWYRHARAYVLSSYKLSDKAAGAIARVRMVTSRRLEIAPMGGLLERENAEGGWDEVVREGEGMRLGDVYRSGGVFFRISRTTR